MRNYRGSWRLDKPLIALLLSIFAITVSSFSLGYSYGRKEGGCLTTPFVQSDAEEVAVEVLV